MQSLRFREPRHPGPAFWTLRLGIKERRKVRNQGGLLIVGGGMLSSDNARTLPVISRKSQAIGGISQPPLLLGSRPDLNITRKLGPGIAVIERRREGGPKPPESPHANNSLRFVPKR